jgi:hypothetical protein
LRLVIGLIFFRDFSCSLNVETIAKADKMQSLGRSKTAQTFVLQKSGQRKRLIFRCCGIVWLRSGGLPGQNRAVDRDIFFKNCPETAYFMARPEFF